MCRSTIKDCIIANETLPASLHYNGIRMAIQISTRTNEKLLNRVQYLNKSIPSSIAHNEAPFHDGIRSNFTLIAPDLQCLNTYRYARNITSGIQEYMEAMSFKHYLESQSLIPYQLAEKQLSELGGEEQQLVLSPEDYILGIFDMTGELMKFGITSMATSGTSQEARELVSQNLGQYQRMQKISRIPVPYPDGMCYMISESFVRISKRSITALTLILPRTSRVKWWSCVQVLKRSKRHFTGSSFVVLKDPRDGYHRPMKDEGGRKSKAISYGYFVAKEV